MYSHYLRPVYQEEMNLDETTIGLLFLVIINRHIMLHCWKPSSIQLLIGIESKYKSVFPNSECTPMNDSNFFDTFFHAVSYVRSCYVNSESSIKAQHFLSRNLFYLNLFNQLRWWSKCDLLPSKKKTSFRGLSLIVFTALYSTQGCPGSYFK